MRYVCALLSVKDINVSRAFYEKWFHLKVAFDFGENVAFDCGLALQQDFDRISGIPTEEITYRSHSGEIYFEEEDLNAFLETLAAHPEITLVHPVKEYGWGQRAVRFYDPDWHVIEVGESMVSVVQRFLRQGLTIEETAKRSQHTITFVEQCAKGLE